MSKYLEFKISSNKKDNEFSFYNDDQTKLFINVKLEYLQNNSYSLIGNLKVSDKDYSINKELSFDKLDSNFDLLLKLFDKSTQISSYSDITNFSKCPFITKDSKKLSDFSLIKRTFKKRENDFDNIIVKAFIKNDVNYLGIYFNPNRENDDNLDIHIFLEVNHPLIKKVEKHLISKKILPDCELYGIAGISCFSLTQALSDEYRSSIKLFGGEKIFTWPRFVEKIINTNKNISNPLEIYHLTYLGVNEKIKENKNNGNLKIVDVTWSQTQGESNPMMDADYFICSGSYLTGNFLKSKMSFLFCRNKEKAEMINNRAYLKSTGIEIRSIKIIEKFIDNKEEYEKKIINQTSILKMIVNSFENLIKLYNSSNNEKLECFNSNGRTYLFIGGTNKSSLTKETKQKFTDFLQSLHIGLTDNVTYSRFFSPNESNGFIKYYLPFLEVILKNKILFKGIEYLPSRAPQNEFDHPKGFWLKKFEDVLISKNL